MKTHAAGIPTEYKGRVYRSRLEARWASFFDLIGWRHEYEPFDLDGWIPDFLLPAAAVVVEIKPVTSFPADVAAKIDGSGLDDDYTPLILGCSIPVVQTTSPALEACDGRVIGWLRKKPMSWLPDLRPTWCDAAVQEFTEMDLYGENFEHERRRDVGFGLFSTLDHVFHCDPGYDPPFDRLHDFASNHFRFGSDVKTWGGASPLPADAWTGRPTPNRLDDLWSEAANRTQWRSPR